MLKDKIQELARQLHADTIANRRHLHTNPELSFVEHNTAAFIEQKLTEIGLPFKRMATTGVIAEIKGKKPGGPIMALRADIDALPIQERNDVPYRSQAPGVMHACGHDVHTSSLLGTARILKALEDEWAGTVKLIFQPGEELLPGGASILIKEGVLENPRPASILGQHTMPELAAGKIGFRSGKYMASVDEIYITVEGKGGHAAMPNIVTDPIMIACQLLSSLQQVVSRHANPLTPSVLSFGRFIGAGIHNVIPDVVTIEGTFRTLDEQWREEAHHRITQISTSLVEGMGGKCHLEIRKGYPVLVNEEKLTALTRQHTADYLGADNVVDLDIWMAAEDFASYSQVADACFYRLGTGNVDRGITSGLHTATFDVDEHALEVSTGLMAWLTLKNLEHLQNVHP